MTAHDHREKVPGCFRCDLSSAEVEPQIFHLESDQGFTRCFNKAEVRVLVDLGLIEHHHDGTDMMQGSQPYGPLVAFYQPKGATDIYREQK